MPARVTGGLLWVVPALLACEVGSQGDPGAGAPETHVVEIREMAFHPTALQVQVGDTIVWINQDFVPHTATAPDSSWTSPSLAQGERWAMVAGAHQTGTYLCAFHPVMKAELVLHPTPSAEE